MRAVAGTAAIPAARCRNLRRGRFIAPPQAYAVGFLQRSAYLRHSSTVFAELKTDNIGGEADIGRASRSCRSVAIDPKRSSTRPKSRIAARLDPRQRGMLPGSPWLGQQMQFDRLKRRD